MDVQKNTITSVGIISARKQDYAVKALNYGLFSKIA